MAKCIVCHANEAEVPDRESMSPRKKVCRPCHGKRLLGDLRAVVQDHAKHLAEDARRRADSAGEKP